MIEHILLWQFTEQAKAEGAAEKLAYLQRRFAALPGRIEGLHRLRLLPLSLIHILCQMADKCVRSLEELL